MSKVSGMCLVGVAIGMALGSAAAQAQEPEAVVVATPAAAQTVMAEAQADVVAPAEVPTGLMGMDPIQPDALANKRGGTDVHNDMLSQGYVSENQAINVTTGANFISEGSFSNAGGVPMVVQNTGNNVLIQNSTILNIQVK